MRNLDTAEAKGAMAHPLHCGVGMGRVIVNEVPMAAAIALLQSEKDRKVLKLLEQFSRAFAAGDGAAASRLCEAPLMVLSEGGTRVVDDVSKLGELLESAGEKNPSRGIATAEPHVDHIDWQSEKLAAVQVRWPGADPSTFVIRCDDAGVARIAAVVLT